MCKPTSAAGSRLRSAEQTTKSKLEKNWSSTNIVIKSYALLPFQIALLIILLTIATPILLVLLVCHDLIMFALVGKTYLYNMSWEDPAIDQRVFNLKNDDHVITIASAGDNVLDYMIEGAEVTAVDFNICQIALTEIKIACIEHLPFEEFFRIFAQNDIDLLRERYHTVVRASLRKEVQKMWDDQLPYLKSFMYSGSSGFLAKLLVKVIIPLCGLNFIEDAIRRRMPKGEFLQLVEKYHLQIKAVSWLSDKILLPAMCLFAGVPKRQLELTNRKTPLGDVLTHIFYNTDLTNDNYFYGGYLLGEFTETCCPRYLMKEHYPALRKAVANKRLHLVHGTFVEACNQAEGRPFTVSSLLDRKFFYFVHFCIFHIFNSSFTQKKAGEHAHFFRIIDMDWMPIPMISAELALLTSKMDLERGRIFWRSFSDTVHSPPLKWLNAKKVDDHDDKVGMYFSTWISHTKDANFEALERVDRLAVKNTGLLGQLKTGAKIVTFPFLQSFYKMSSMNKSKSKHGKAMEAFYAHQKEDYDSFRENMLHGRPWLMHSFPIKKEGKMVWVDVGGGTARNLEFIPKDVVRDKFSKIVILDISPSLLEMAKARVDSMGLSDIVELVEEDFTNEASFKALPTKGSVDVVTMSYSLSMIPDKKKAIKRASELVKPNGEGYIMVTDFFALPSPMVREENPSAGFRKVLRTWESVFHKKWFANDHVYLLEEEILGLMKNNCNNLLNIWDSRERGNIPFLPFLKPIHGLVIATSENEK